MAVAFTVKEDPNNKLVIEALKRLPETSRLRIQTVVDRFLLNVLRDSKTTPPRVPVDTGALQSTGHVEPAVVDSKGIRGSVAYGGFANSPYNIDVDYAVLIHEDMSGRQYHRPGSGPKYVETHWMKRMPELARELNEAMKRSAQESSR